MDHTGRSFHDLLEREASCFGTYLLGRCPNQKSIELYVQAMSVIALPVSGKDRRRISFVLRFPRLLSLVDGGLSLTEPSSAIRSKLFVMLGILECQVAYTHLFLPKPFSAFDFVRVFFFGICAAYRGVLGYFLLRLI